MFDGSWVGVLTELLGKVEAEVKDDIDTYNKQIDEAAKERKFGLGTKLTETLRTIESRELLGFLANKNVLPKYGFPVDTVELRTLHATDSIGRQLELSRDLGLAIYEYAPGNQVVAGGKIWTSAGLRMVPGKRLVELSYRVCEKCKRFESGHVLDDSAACPTCSTAFKPARRLVRPEFGFTAERDTRDVRHCAARTALAWRKLRRECRRRDRKLHVEWRKRNESDRAGRHKGPSCRSIRRSGQRLPGLPMVWLGRATRTG